MSHHIPFNEETYRPKSLLGNDTADNPVEFELSQVGGPDLVRLKQILFALGAVGMVVEFTPELSRNCCEALTAAPGLFARGVDAIRNFTVPAAMAVKAGVLKELGSLDRKAPVPITTGADFARIAGYQTVLALEIALRISAISEEGEIDPRFFVSPITSRTTDSTASGSSRSGVVMGVRPTRARRATAGKSTARARG